MFVIFLRFSSNKAAAQDYMAAHNAWIAQGFADGVFLCAGSLGPAAGGAVLAQGEARTALESRVEADPFVAQGVVAAEIHEIDPKRTIPSLDFLKGTDLPAS
ncbi:YciI family protein [Oricola cellulosilytica]|uniref:YCII-related domain-containing protein n=1 Tax=Oricola cellulosilytica TaxID=1429082 RepID=A0A4R0PA02_9HYPH|nr:YciI family protein [Oricola cellulosilytica]TCD14082.1 hypothetical protein E0D97_08285 [Oricola cellulosilytica]